MHRFDHILGAFVVCTASIAAAQVDDIPRPAKVHAVPASNVPTQPASNDDNAPPPQYRVDDAFKDDALAPGVSVAPIDGVPGIYISSASIQPPPRCQYHPCSGCAHCRSDGIKAWLQRSHWGYCDRFETRPFGSAVLSAMTVQSRRGLANTMMLYDFDFNARKSHHPEMLNQRGRAQLLKILSRQQVSPTLITVQSLTENPQLTLARRHSVVNSLSVLGIEGAEQMVIVAPQRLGVPANEAIQRQENFLEDVDARGRTLNMRESLR